MGPSRFRPLLAALLLLAAPASRADVQIVSDVWVEGAAQPGLVGTTGGQTTRRTIKTFYKGNRVRTDTSGMVLIYDAAADRLFALDPARKTYTVNPVRAARGRMEPWMAMMKIETRGNVRPGGATQTIAGLPARNYRIFLVQRMRLTEQGAARQGLPPGPVLTMRMEGEQWASQAVDVPPRVQRMMTTSVLRSLGPTAGPLQDKMATIRGVPLSSRVTMTITPARPVSGDLPAPLVTTTTIQTRSVVRKTLPAALFAVPAGYRKVEPAAGGEMPGFPVPPG